MSSSAQIDNKKKDILVPGKGTTQGLEHTFFYNQCWNWCLFCLL